eukprot:scaffold101750_cov16-Tisochrysis_lutea.AAC.1
MLHFPKPTVLTTCRQHRCCLPLHGQHGRGLLLGAWAPPRPAQAQVLLPVPVRDVVLALAAVGAASHPGAAPRLVSA